MPFIATNGSAQVLVPAGQKIAVSSFGSGQAVISYLNQPSNAAPIYYEAARLSNAIATYGPFAADRMVQIESGQTSQVEYVVGAAPTVTDQMYNSSAVQTITLAGTPAVLTNPTVQCTNSVDNYTQISIQNKSATANSSADLIAYPDNVSASDLTGFMDMGITSSAYAQAAYAITGSNEAYLFGSAPAGAGKTGDMVIATDSTGSANSIWFGTGGFASLANRRAGFVGANFRPYANASCGLGVAGIGFTKLYMDYTNTGTIGAVTINKAAGRVNVAAAATSVVVTNSLCTAASHVMATISQNDGTAVLKNVVPAAGSFTINLNAAATANTSVDFFIINAD